MFHIIPWWNTIVPLLSENIYYWCSQVQYFGSLQQPPVERSEVTSPWQWMGWNIPAATEGSSIFIYFRHRGDWGPPQRLTAGVWLSILCHLVDLCTHCKRFVLSYWALLCCVPLSSYVCMDTRKLSQLVTPLFSVIINIVSCLFFPLVEEVFISFTSKSGNTCATV